MAISHIKTVAIADGTNTQIVRPSDWNSVHVGFSTVVGNTAGQSTASGSNIVLAGGNNVTLSVNQGAGAATISVVGAAGGVGNTGYISAGTATASLGTVIFSNANGVSFGVDGQTVTASVRTDYLTTAMASNRGSDFVQATAAFAGTHASGTIASNGLSVSVAAQTVQPVAASAANGSAAFSTLSFSNANGVSFSTAAGPAIVASHNGLTTARASNDGIGLNTAQSNVTWTVNSSGLSLDARGYAGTVTGATNASVTANSNGISVSVGNYLTTARASTDAIGLNTAGSNITWTANSNGLSIDARGYAGTATGATNASLTVNSGGVSVSVGNYLTTARASNDAVGLNTALTAGPLAWTVNSAGISLNAGSAAGTTSGFAGNLISGSMTHNTAGLNLSLNHPAWLTTAMASNAATISNIRVSAGTTSNLLSALTFANSNGITFGLNASTLTASHNGLTTARASNDGIGLNTAQSNVTWTVNSSGLSLDARGYAGTGTTFNGANISGSMTVNSVGVQLSLSGGGGGTTNQTGPNIAAGTQTATSGTVVFSNSNGITFGMSDSSVVTASYAPALKSGYAPMADIPLVIGQVGQGTLQFEPEELPAAQWDRIVFQVHNTNSSNSSGSHTLSFWVGLYTRNASTLSLWGSTSTTLALTHSGTVGSYSLYSGIRHVTIPWTTTVTENDYWIGFLSRTTSGGANGTYSNLVLSNVNSNFLGHFGSSHNTTYQLTLGQGVYSATTNALPGSVGFSQIRGSDSAALRPPNIYFASGTV